MKIKKLLIMLFMALSISQSFGLEYRPFMQCGNWVENRKEGRQSAVSEGSLLGFLSGWQAHSGRDVFKGASNESIFLWMDNYCQKNPLSNTYDGALKLDFELDGIYLKQELEQSNKARIGIIKK